LSFDWRIVGHAAFTKWTISLPTSYIQRAFSSHHFVLMHARSHHALYTYSTVRVRAFTRASQPLTSQPIRWWGFIWCYIKQIMNVLRSSNGKNNFIRWQMECTIHSAAPREWNIPSVTSWNYSYHWTHKHSLFVYYITDIQILVIWLVELTSRDIHYCSHSCRGSKSPIRPWWMGFTNQQLGSSLFSQSHLTIFERQAQTKTWGEGCDPLMCCLTTTHNILAATSADVPTFDRVYFRHWFKGKSNDKDLYVSYIKQILSGFKLWNGRNIIAR